MANAHKMGTRSDIYARNNTQRCDNLMRQKLVNWARALIYEGNKAVSNTEVEDLLQPTSLVPTQNAFSQQLLPLKFDFHKIFVFDLLHEIELGVWKSLFQHLVRILYGCGPDIVAEFNRRFRQVPTFCNSTIRKFSEDVASMKRLAARDFEDILQVELQHRKAKAQWERTNMRDAIPQMVRIGDIGDALDTIKTRLDKLECVNDLSPSHSDNNTISQEPYWIGQTDRSEDMVSIPLWIDKHAWDCAVKRMNFLWVRWLDYDEGQPGGWDVGRLDRVSYGKCRNDSELLDAFGFIDPGNIVRASHLIPDFSSGIHCTIPNKIAASVAYDSEEGDWGYYYVSRFVDRDMFMRYLGGGIGHYNQHPPNDTGGGEAETSYVMGDSDVEEMDIEEVQIGCSNHGGGGTGDNNDQDGDERDDLWGAGESDAGSEFAASEGEDEDFVEDLYEL
ncbi:hypothetical protein FRC06_010846 [Ceratobasidium sp. 370]|nr:hypothetical protein FRC06_010846 [Ceratobasidium sp. 370]